MKLDFLTPLSSISTPLHVGSPMVEKELLSEFYFLLDGVFKRNHLTNSGPLVCRLEEEIAQRNQVKYALAVNNATIAQLLILKSLDLSHGEALISSNTFVATAHTCVWQGLTFFA